MAKGDSTYTRTAKDKITLAEAQALIQSKVADELKGPLVTIRFTFALSVVALAIALIALTVAVVR